MENQSPYTVVVGIDFDSEGDQALDEAIRLVGREPKAELHLIYVDREMSLGAVAAAEAETSGVNHITTRTQNALDKLEALCNARIEAVTKDDTRIRFRRAVTHFRLGNPAEEIVQLAVDLDADLIVVGTHSRKGLKRLFLGSVAEKVAHVARCPVTIVRDKDHEGAGDVPAIEPPCPKCIAVRRQSDGEDLWCEQHKLAKHHPRAHRYSYSWGSGDSVAPTDTLGGPTIN